MTENEEMKLMEHYQKMDIQPFAVMRLLLTKKELIGFIKGNIIKYTMRSGKKPGQSAQADLIKAKDYANILVSEEYDWPSGGRFAINDKDEYYLD